MGWVPVRCAARVIAGAWHLRTKSLEAISIVPFGMLLVACFFQFLDPGLLLLLALLLQHCDLATQCFNLLMLSSLLYSRALAFAGSNKLCVLDELSMVHACDMRLTLLSTINERCSHSLSISMDCLFITQKRATPHFNCWLSPADSIKQMKRGVALGT